MLFKTETHLHTKESSICAKMYAEDMVKLYKGAGYNTIIVTNHYSSKNIDIKELSNWDDKIDHILKGYKIAKQFEDIYNINILFAIELTLKQNDSDYLIYGIREEFLRENKGLYDLSLEKLYELCVDNGFLIIQAHPFRDEIELAPKELIMGVEIYNGCQNEISRNELAAKYAKENNLIGTSGSDFHHQNDLARGGIITKEEIKTIDDYIQAVKSNNFEIIS